MKKDLTRLIKKANESNKLKKFSEAGACVQLKRLIKRNY